jgi:hypothetical protein
VKAPGGTPRRAKRARCSKRSLAALTGKTKRGNDPHVRRGSYDVDDPRAKVWRPIGDGTVAGGLGWVEDLVQIAKEFDAQSRRESSRGHLTPYGITVLEALCRGNQLDFKTGKLDPAIAWIEKVTGFARKTVVDALARLKRHGFLDWVRRSRKTGNDRQAGPQREQETNAYFFDVGRLPRAALQRFRQLRERRKRRSANGAPAAPAPAREVADPALRAALDRLGALVPGASLT